MVVSGQIHALATLSQGEEPIALEKGKCLMLCQESNFDACVVQPIA